MLKGLCNYKCLGLISLSAFAVNAHANGTIQGTPSASLSIDGSVFKLTVEPVDGGWEVPPGTVVRSQDATVTFTDGVKINPDPSIAYGFAVIDFGAPSVFGFSFSSPIVPTGPGSLVASTIAGGLTDLTDNGASLTPTGAKAQTSGASSTGIGGPFTGLGVDVGPTFTAAGGGSGLPVAYVYGPDALGLVTGPLGGPFNALKVDLGFALSGGGDVAALTGSASIVNAVPEGGPGMAGLAALVGLIGVVSLKRRQS